MKHIVHAQPPDGTDYTLCGFGYDDEEGDYIEAPIIARPGDNVTCKECRVIIAYCKSFKHNRQPEFSL